MAKKAALCKAAFRTKIHVLGFDTILAIKSLNTSCSVYKLLFAGKEGVTGGANFNLYVLYRRTGLDDIATGAGYGSELVLWMNTFLHKTLRSHSPIREPRLLTKSENQPLKTV